MKSFLPASLGLLCCWLLLTAATGCGGGGDSASSAPAGSPSSPPPPAASLPEEGSSEPASMPDQNSVADGSGAAMPGDGGGMMTTSEPMSDPAMLAEGTMGPAGSFENGMGMSPGMPGMGMPGMGMPGMGMPGMGMNAGPVDPTPSDDDDFMTKAKYAFSIGKESVGEQYLYAHILTNEADAPALLQQIRWSPAGKRPISTMRFAVGVDLKAPPNVTDYQPIGRTQFAQQNNQAGGGGGGEMGMSGGMPGMQTGQQGTQKTFGDLTGRFGEELMKSFETAWDSGSFGTVFKDVETQEPFVRPNMPGMNMGMGMPGMAGVPGMEMNMAEGMSGMPGMPGMPGAPGAAAADVTPRLRAVPGKVIVPGLLYLGTGSTSELVGKAETEGIDFVFIFDVEVKISRFITNETRLRLVSAKDQSVIGATSTLKSLTVDRDMARGEKDDVAKQLGNVFKKIDTIKLVDLPKLQPVHAQARIKYLIDKKAKEPLTTLMEVKLFHSLGLLNDEERDAAYQLAIGGHGLAFTSGTVEDREFVLKPMLPAFK